MAFGTPMNLDLPTLSEDMATIIAKLVTALEAVETALDPAIGSGSLNLTTALSMNGAALTSVGGVRLSGGTSAVVGTVYMGADNELHVVTAAGDVKITAGGALDIISATNGFGGDYGAGAEAATFDNASDEYRFKFGAGANDWADLVCDDVVLQNGATGSTRLGSDATGATTIKFGAMPGSGVALLAYDASTNKLFDATGQTISWGLSFTSTIATSAEVNAGGTMSAADFGHSTEHVHMVNAACMNAAPSGPTFSSNNNWEHGTAAGVLYIPLPAKVLDTLTQWKVFLYKVSGAGATVTAGLWQFNASTGVITQIGVDQTYSGTIGYTTIGQSGLSTTILSNCTYYLRVVPSGTTGDSTLAAEVRYTRSV